MNPERQAAIHAGLPVSVPALTVNRVLRFGIARPTLVMAGTDDPLVPVANGHILAHLSPKARLVTIDDGHLFLVTSAGRSAALISDFLTQDPAHS